MEEWSDLNGEGERYDHMGIIQSLNTNARGNQQTNQRSDVHFLFAFQEALRTQTVDNYFEKNPKMKKEIDDELAQQNWGY